MKAMLPICRRARTRTKVSLMTVDTTQSERQPTTPEADMLDAVRRRLIGIHYSLAEATNDDLKVRSWAASELMALIRELAPYRKLKSALLATDTSGAD